jgi:FtsH-binding integral membrane protein
MSSICNDYETDEHLIAAVALYLDILGIFTYVLALFGGSSND